MTWWTRSATLASSAGRPACSSRASARAQRLSSSSTTTVPGARYGAEASAGTGTTAGTARASAGSTSVQPTRSALGLVSRAPSACGRSLLSSKISRQRSASPSSRRASPINVSPGATSTDPVAVAAVTGLGAATVDSWCGASTTSADSTRPPPSGPGLSAIAEPTRPATGRRIRIAATSRWATSPTPVRERAGAARWTRPVEAGRAADRSSATWVRSSTTSASTKRSHTSQASTASTPTTRPTSSRISTRPRPGHGLPTTREEHQRHPDDDDDRRQERPERWRDAPVRAHGAAPVVTPSSGVEVDDVETDRPPGRIR